MAAVWASVVALAAVRSAAATISSARAWALASVVAASAWERLVSSPASRRASATSVAASEELRSCRRLALVRVRESRASASALALDSTVADCSSALRSSCSMRDPRPA